MDLLVVRHAVAVERETFAATGKPDDLRPLTADGQRKMRQIGKGLQSLVDGLDLLVTSPLTRAAQTAEVLARAYGIKVGEVVEALRPGAPFPAFAQWASTRDAASTIAIVGHEPHLSGLVTWLMTGGNQPRIALKKGGACLLTFTGVPRRAEGTLEWLATASQLRRLGD